MSVDLSSLRQGSIVWAVVRDERGYRKRRPAIVLTPTSSISLDQPLVVMAITTTYPDPPPSSCVELPWNHDSRRVATGLARRSAAVVNWMDVLYADELDGLIGRAPTGCMREILRKLQELDRHNG